ncbi:MAG: polymer-forming cytoskeletal protein [Bacillota bacterium]|nr:polymer-forming cytoskeletal protein [Bacillota bacterium]
MSKENNQEKACTRITNSMVVNGGITSSDNLLIEGQVFGDVSTEADLTANNLIVGNVKANNMSFNSARIKGDVETDGALAVGDSTIVIGNIDADALKISGKVHGDITANQYILLTNTALIVGDITAAVVTTQAGSRINGTITTQTSASQVDVDSEFDLGDIPDPTSAALFTVEPPKPVAPAEPVEQQAEAEPEAETEGGDF